MSGIARSWVAFALLASVWLTTMCGCSGSGSAPQTGQKPATKQNNSGKKKPRQKQLPQSKLRFTDVTDKSEIGFRYSSGAEANECTMLETLGGGVALLDFDGDGRLDVFSPGGGRFQQQKIVGLKGGLFRNLGDNRFEDVTARSGLDHVGRYSHGAIAADYNNDGHIDLLVTGYGGLALFRNNGDGTFTETAQSAGIADQLWSSSAAWGDFNRDGFIDLYVAHYVDWTFAKHPICTARRAGSLAGGSGQRDVCSPKTFRGLPDTIYFNQGNGSFENVTEKLGLKLASKGIGVLVADLELDGDSDVYVANDTDANFLIRNDNGKLKEVGTLSGAGYGPQGNEDGSMGIGLGDVDGDGKPDLCVSNFQNEIYALYRGTGNARFVHSSSQTGLTLVGNRYVGWGMAFCDFDHDLDEDLVATNGHVLKFPDEAPRQQLPFLFENRQQGWLENVAAAAGKYFSTPHEGRGLAIGDLDADGDIDIVINDVVGGVVLLRNDSSDVGNWLSLRLIGTRSNRDALGAIVEVHVGKTRLTRQRFSGGSFASTSSPQLHFGLGKESRASIKIRWPGGTTQSFTTDKLNRQITIVEM